MEDYFGPCIFFKIFKIANPTNLIEDMAGFRLYPHTFTIEYLIMYQSYAFPHMDFGPEKIF